MVSSDQTVHFIASEMWHWGHVYVMSALTMFPIALKQLN